jgi:hypothetical protein
MATAAQIEANRRNAKRSTGPKTEAGKKRARLNALKHGRRAKAVAPDLPLEDPEALEERIRQWVRDLKPGDVAERALVVQAAKISSELDGLERYEADLRARRLEDAQSKPDGETAKAVCDLGRKLFYWTGKRNPPTSGKRNPPTAGPPWDDDPEVFLRGLEGSVEGCRWLLDRWVELKRMFVSDEVKWSDADLYRFFRLQGKQPLSAIYDPELNLQFLAWDVIGNDFTSRFWKRCCELTPPSDPGFSGTMFWRGLVERPASQEAALAVVDGVIDGRIARLEEMIGLYEELADEEATERSGAAWFDPGPEAEAVRRRRSALVRELRQTIELILKMQAARQKREAREGDAAREGEAPAERTCTVPSGDDDPSLEPDRPPGVANADLGEKPRLSSADHKARRDEGSRPPRKGEPRGRRIDPYSKSLEKLLAGEPTKFMFSAGPVDAGERPGEDSQGREEDGPGPAGPRGSNEPVSANEANPGAT